MTSRPITVSGAVAGSTSSGTSSTYSKSKSFASTSASKNSASNCTGSITVNEKTNKTYSVSYSVKPTAAGSFSLIYDVSFYNTSGSLIESDTVTISGTASGGETTQYTLTLTASPSAGGTVSGAGKYDAGTSATVSASANSGYTFSSWSDGGARSHSVPMNSDKSLTAYFTEDEPEPPTPQSLSGNPLDFETSESFSSVTIYSSSTKMTTGTWSCYSKPSWVSSVSVVKSGSTQAYVRISGTAPSSATSGTYYIYLQNSTDTIRYKISGSYTVTAPVQDIIVTFDARGGSVSPSSKTVYYGSTYGTLPTPTSAVTGQVFTGWFTTSTGGTQVTSSTTVTKTSSHTLYAHYETAIITVTFNGNGGTPSYSSYSYAYGAKYEPLPSAERTDYIFLGWFTSSSGGTQITENTTVNRTTDQTLYAQWEEEATHVNVSFYKNAPGSEFDILWETITETVGEKYVLPSTSPTVDNYEFAGWWTSETGGTRLTVNTTVTEDVTRAYAHWNAVVVTISTAFNYNASITDTRNYATLTETVGNKFILPSGTPTNPDAPLRTFNGWWTHRGDDGTQVTTNTTVEASMTTLFAHWVNGSVTVTFDAQGGTPDGQTKVCTIYGTYGTMPTVTKDGNAFEGWYTSATGGSLVTSSTEVNTNQNHTLYARWRDLSVTVTLDAQGGELDEDTITLIATEPYGELPTPTHDRLTFTGWFTASEGGTQIVESTIVPEGDHTIYAQWIDNGLLVTLDARGGHVEPSFIPVVKGGTYGQLRELPTPTYTGYEFAGWWTAPTSGSRVTDTTTVTATEDHTIYAQWTEITSTFTLVYNANGGTGAPSTQTITDAGLTHTFTISTSDPTKSEAVFIGWASTSTANWPEYLSGGKITVGPGTTTIYAIWMDDTPIEGEPVDHVRIYKNPNGAYIDVTDMLGTRSTIKEVENYGITATFTIVNDVDTATNNLLSSSCNLWSTGTGAVDTGMFVQIRHGSDTGAPWGWFYIASLDAADDLLTVTCGDYIQWLRANGAEYYRNHYDPTGYDHRWPAVEWTEDEELVFDKPSGISLVGGSAGDVKIIAPGPTVSKDYDREVTGVSTIKTTLKIRNTAKPNPPDTAPAAISAITIYGKRRSSYDRAFRVQIHLGATEGVLLAEETISATSTSEYQALRIELDAPVYIFEDSYITVKILDGHATGMTQNYQVGTDAGSTTVYNGTTTLTNTSLRMDLEVLTYQNAEGSALSDTRWKITAVSSGATIDETLSNPIINARGEEIPRGWFEFMDPSAGVSISEVVRNIVGAAQGTVALASMERSITMFRCAGGDYHSYLLALADMAEDDEDGRQHAFSASQTVWKGLTFGYRRRATDVSAMHLSYAMDEVANSTVMLSFSPRKTRQFRPSTAVSKGLDNEGRPIIVCVKDPDVSLGSSIETVASTDTSSAQAALNAYAKIITNRTTDWEGECVIDGIHPEVMSRIGQYIGGVPVRVTDSRYGMSSMKARVREATYDYQNLTTTLVLNNYSEVYSNSIGDTSKMAYQAGTMAIAESSTDLYTRQYVFVDAPTLSVDPTTTITVQVKVGTEWTEAVNAETISYPELGIATIVAYIPAGEPYSLDKYAVDTIKVNNVQISIPEYVRPDKRDEQYLIVNVQVRL